MGRPHPGTALAFEKNRAIEDRRNEDRFHFIEWTRWAFENVDVIPAGNGIMHQINLERMSPVFQTREGVAFPDTCVGNDSHVTSLLRRCLPRKSMPLA
ncbi:aconitase family protein [Rhodospirillum sp. A1_3_36]|uniref:aconitase family protein n=1 Tax=Rhodospirillum sp. A1_3_36 TaxID=3391666 RepID=UPI0039A69805